MALAADYRYLFYFKQFIETAAMVGMKDLSMLSRFYVVQTKYFQLVS